MSVSVSFAQQLDPASCECFCAPLLIACLYGPDGFGNFATTEVPPEEADSCDRSKCTCTSHDDYAVTARERLESAIAVYSVDVAPEFDHGLDSGKLIDGDAPTPTLTENDRPLPNRPSNDETVQEEPEEATAQEEESL